MRLLHPDCAQWSHQNVSGDRCHFIGPTVKPVAFIFSNSALREGWDNPNVCQICTLNQTVSEVKKRQEVGRGMRLVVNQDGQRISDDKVNILTVVANESYEQFVSTLQAEMIEAFGEAGAAPKPVNAREKHVAKRKPLDELPEDFANLWEKIKPRTRYQVTVNAEKLITDVVGELDLAKIEAPRIVASKAEVTIDKDKDLLDYQLFGRGVLATVLGRQGVPNIVSMIEDLIAHITPPIKLTRKTLCAIVLRRKTARRRWTILRPSPCMRRRSSARRRFSSWWMASSITRTGLGTT